MSYTTGSSKSLDDITLEDALKFTIWEWALDEEGVDGQDETWQRPIVNTDNVTEEIFNPTITLKIKGTDLFGTAEFDFESQSLSAISIWISNEWVSLDKTQISMPITLIAMPKIDGVSNVQFRCTGLHDDYAEVLSN